MKLPLVSIIIPCFNYGHLLIETLESLLDQSFTNWECIVVDDGSQDSTAMVVANMVQKDLRYRYVFQENKGQAAARNRGLLHAKGDYVQFLDADDFIESEKLKKQVTLLEENRNLDIVYGEVRYFRSGEPNILFLDRWLNREKDWMPGVSGSGEKIVEAFIIQNIVELGCILFRKSILNEVEGFDERIQGVEDWDLCIRCALKGKEFKFDPAQETRILMRLHPVSFSKQKERMEKAMLIFRKKLEGNLVAYPRLKNLNKKSLLVSLGKPAFYEISTGKLSLGLKQLLKAIQVTRNYFYYLKVGVYWLGIRLFRKSKAALK